jgi:hypothetical protein
VFLKAKFELGPEAIIESASDPETGGFALRLKLDPGVLVITASHGPDGPRELAAFLSRLSSEASLLAVALDPSALRHPELDGRENVGQLAHWFSQSGSGGFGPEVGQ